MKKDEIDAVKIVIEELFKGLDSIDKTYQVESSNIEVFTQMVESEQALLKKKFRRDLLVYSLIALFILSAVFFSLLEAPGLFIKVQAILAVLFPLLAFYQNQYKQRVVHQ